MFPDGITSVYPDLQIDSAANKFRSTYALQQAYYALRDGLADEFEDVIRAYRK
jgi:hypothetical protein